MNITAPYPTEGTAPSTQLVVGIKCTLRLASNASVVILSMILIPQEDCFPSLPNSE